MHWCKYLKNSLPFPVDSTIQSILEFGCCTQGAISFAATSSASGELWFSWAISRLRRRLFVHRNVVSSGSTPSDLSGDSSRLPYSATFGKLHLTLRLIQPGQFSVSLLLLSHDPVFWDLCLFSLARAGIPGGSMYPFCPELVGAILGLLQLSKIG